MLPSDTKGKIYMVLNVITLVIIIILSVKFYKVNQSTQQHVERIETLRNDGKYQQIYNDRELVELKEENKSLYDSIKCMQNQIDFLATFKYKYEHNGDTVKVNNDTINNDSIQIFKYFNPKPDDKMQYVLTIGSQKNIDWYKLNFTLNDDFVIVNKKLNDVNETTIDSNLGQIEGGFFYSKPTKKTWKERFVFGPSITAGYDVINKKPGLMLGFSCTFDIR